MNKFDKLADFLASSLLFLILFFLAAVAFFTALLATGAVACVVAAYAGVEAVRRRIVE